MRIFIIAAFLILSKFSFTQSIEIMPGTDNLFFDIQFLKPLKKNDYKFTVFSRTRGIVDYESNANILSAAYVSYTSKIGLGVSIIGAVNSSNGPNGAAGVNFLKVKNNFTIFALAAVEAHHPIGYSLFTIIRYTPDIKDNWKLYSSLELFTLYRKGGHEVSSERIRLGLDHKNFQFGLGANLTQFGNEFTAIDNYGLFIRKSFN